jgi:uncharacterized membrane protein
MGTYRGLSRRARIALVVVSAALAAAGSAEAFQALPAGQQVNDDPAAGISPAAGVNGEDPTNADVVGGALVAGKPAVPWAIFRQQETAGHDQIFSRSFAGGAWTTRGNGTIGGRSSASPTFSGSLNFDQGQDGEAPAIDFAGAGRTVPWATWYENTTGTGFGANNIFASRFDATSGKWIFAGQGRGNGGTGPNVPSLNIHTDQSAENPSVAGGSAVDPSKPGPWVTWQETTSAPVDGKNQIFVSKPVGPGAANCDGVTPTGMMDLTGHVPAIGGFCFQQVGVQRVGPSGADPSLNVDVKRDGIEPDIAFTGTADGVPWVVWYETGGAGTAGLAANDMVFAAKAEADTAAGVSGGFHWHVIGNSGNGILNAANSCAGTLAAEQACSLNSDPSKDAEDPRVAAGTMNPANATAPWVTWSETTGGVKQVFVSRFVATPTPHFQIVNGGNPISTAGVPATRPDITFSGNTPYVTWREETPSGTKGFVGHFVNAANPTIVLDESDIPLTPTGTGAGHADVREPVSSTCIATPFNLDGSSCQGGALGTPFFLFTNGTSPLGLFAGAYQPGVPVTGGASAISTSAATLSGTVNPQGAAIKVHFDFGTTSAYGQSTPDQAIGVGNTPAGFSAALTGLPAGTTIHYRAVASSDFGTFAGADQTLTTSPGSTPPPTIGTVHAGHAKVSGKAVAVKLTCTGAPGTQCPVTLKLTARGRHHKVVNAGTARVTLIAGQTRIARISLNGTGRGLLAARHTLRVKLVVAEATAGGHAVTVAAQTVTFRTHRHGRH